jgi:hypothetical protein
MLLTIVLTAPMLPNAKIMNNLEATLIIEKVVFYAIDVLFNIRERLDKMMLISAFISLLMIVFKSI